MNDEQRKRVEAAIAATRDRNSKLRGILLNEYLWKNCESIHEALGHAPVCKHCMAALTDGLLQLVQELEGEIDRYQEQDRSVTAVKQPKCEHCGYGSWTNPCCNCRKVRDESKINRPKAKQYLTEIGE